MLTIDATIRKKFGGINDAVNTFSCYTKRGRKNRKSILTEVFSKNMKENQVDNLVALDKNLNSIALTNPSDGIKDPLLAAGQALAETGPTY